MDSKLWIRAVKTAFNHHHYQFTVPGDTTKGITVQQTVKSGYCYNCDDPLWYQNLQKIAKEEESEWVDFSRIGANTEDVLEYWSKIFRDANANASEDMLKSWLFKTE